MDTTIEFIDYCIELYPSFFLCQEPNKKFVIKKTRLLDEEIVDIIQYIYICITKNITFELDINNINSFVISACLLMRVGQSDVHEDAIQKVKDAIKKFTPKDIDQIQRYKPPIKAIFCGDRDSSGCFEEQIIMELKALPKYSLVLHGGCKGVDLYVDQLAKQMGIKCKRMDADWSTGRSAGPIRNEQMLKERPNIIFAFHPDIMYSKGTRDMMTRGYKSGVPVYIHDLKRKSKFEGNFDIL